MWCPMNLNMDFFTLCSIVFGLFEWKRICAGFLSFVYMYSRWDPITRREGWGLINQLNPEILCCFLCLSHTRTYFLTNNIVSSIFFQWLQQEFGIRVIRWVWLVEQELLSLPEHLSSLTVLVGYVLLNL